MSEPLNLPTKAISIMQPWADLICFGVKDIENRDWRTNFRGWVLIHAGKKMDQDALADLHKGICPADGLPLIPTKGVRAPLNRGGIVGVAEIVDCVDQHSSRWFVGRYGFVLRNARPLPFHPCKGALSLFTPHLLELANAPASEGER